MNTVVYDGSFEGFLTAVFEIYEYKIPAPAIVRENEGKVSLFSTPHTVYTNISKAERVCNKLKEKLPGDGFKNFLAAFLSGISKMEDILFDYARMVFSADKNIQHNYSSETVLWVQQTSKKVYRERHRMEAFVRFKLTVDGLYYALIEPDFNVIPLLITHFEKRYADQRWLIFDISRKYGAYYDLRKTEIVQMDLDEMKKNIAAKENGIHDRGEQLFQKLWQQYFSGTNIKARKNTKLHLQHMPRRYWKYLTEKHPGI